MINSFSFFNKKRDMLVEFKMNLIFLHKSENYTNIKFH